MTFSDLQKTIGVTFKDEALLKMAFVHRSYLNEVRGVTQSNERLEFLGDAVLELLTSDYLYQTYPDYPEGILTNIRSALVKTESLAAVAKKLDLGALLFLSRGEEATGGRDNVGLLADTLEAVIGALYLDQGFEAVEEFLNQSLFPKFATIKRHRLYKDAKSQLQEIVQGLGLATPEYQIVKEEGPDHDKQFTVSVLIGGQPSGRGSGHSKQVAQQAAARQALEKFPGQ